MTKIKTISMTTRTPLYPNPRSINIISKSSLQYVCSLAQTGHEPPRAYRGQLWFRERKPAAAQSIWCSTCSTVVRMRVLRSVWHGAHTPRKAQTFRCCSHDREKAPTAVVRQEGGEGSMTSVLILINRLFDGNASNNQKMRAQQTNTVSGLR